MRRASLPAFLAAMALPALGCGHPPATVTADRPTSATPPLAPAAAGFALRANDVVVLAGGANLERTRFNGSLSTWLAADPALRIRVRNMAWEGDTVFEQWRHDGLDAWRRSRDWAKLLVEVGATVVLAQFGQLESLAGPEGLPAFVRQAEGLLSILAADGRRVVVLSPVPFERPLAAAAPDLSRRNGDLALYGEALRALAARRGWRFVDLLGPLARRSPPAERLTEDGLHLHERGHRVVADLIARDLNLRPPAPQRIEAVRAAVLAMERLWFDTWRPMNWSFLAGDRTTVPFGRDWRNQDVFLFPEEMKQFAPLLAQADENVWRAAAGELPAPHRPAAPPAEPGTVEPQTPAQEAASFKVLPGYEVNLFASEDNGVVKPIQMRWDERGRLWVASTLSYPQIKPGDLPNDYITVCEDTDRDGRVNQCRKFVEGLFMPSGLELGDGGVYVAQGTELLHFRDRDGDGRADERRIVMGGFGTGDSHQMINSLRWGFSGELWFTQGHHIQSRVETPYGVEHLNRSGVWRFRPRSLRLDPFFQMSSAGENCWGVITDAFGQVFHKSGSETTGFYSVPGLIRSALPLSGDSMRLFKGVTKQVGMEMVASTHLPRALQGRVLLGGFYENAVQVHALDERDGQFSSRLLKPLIETTNPSFRPIDVELGPDGAIYVADWYNPIIGHYQASFRHPDRDKAHGRIWRIRAKGRPLVKPPRLAGATAEALLPHLGSPERWVTYQTKRLLFGMDSQTVTVALDRWVAGLKPGRQGDLLRLHALSLYEAHEAVRPELLNSLLRSPDFRVRAYATRAVGHWHDRLADPTALIARQVDDEHPRVRLEAVVAGSYLRDPSAVTVVTRVLGRASDPYLEHALAKAVNATRPHWEPALARGALAFSSVDHFLYVLAHEPMAGTPGILRGLLRDRRGDRDGARKILVVLADQGDAADLRAVFDHARDDGELLAPLVETARRRSIAPPIDDELGRAFGALLDRVGARHLPSVIALAGLWDVGAVSARVETLAAAETTAPAARKEAVTTLGRLRGKDALPLLTGLLDGKNSELAAAALAMIAELDLARAAVLVAERLAASQAAAAFSQWLRPVLRRSGGSDALAAALGQRPLTAVQARHALSALGMLGRGDKTLVAVLSGFAGLPPESLIYDPLLIRELASEVRQGGRRAVGQDVFRTVGCANCHVIGKEGRPIGPDLSSLGRGLPLEAIITEVLWPQINVKEGFIAAAVTTKSGRTIEGLLKSDGPTEITVLDMLTARPSPVRRGDIQSLTSGGSVMPEGLTAGLTRGQLVDLLRYLSDLGR